MKDYLKCFINEFKSELDIVKSEYYNFDFNTSELPDVHEYTYSKDITKNTKFEEMFNILRVIRTNCLYWFSVNNFEDADLLKQIISDKKSELWSEDKNICRILPAKNSNSNSKVVYVGVRKGGYVKKHNASFISGRIVQHMGYYKEGRTQGLQLAYYTRVLNIDMSLNIYLLDDCPDEYLYILEKIFAKKLKPICGKH